MTGVKLTFHMPPLMPRRTASPDWTTNRTGNGVAASSFAFASIASTSALCCGWMICPSPGTPGADPPLRVSPYAMNEKRVTPAEAASVASGVAGGSIGFTATIGNGGGAGAGGCAGTGCCAATAAPARTTLKSTNCRIGGC